MFQRADHHRTEHGSEDRSGAAEDVDAADDDRGDGLKFEPAAGLDRDVAEAGKRHEPGEAGEGAAEDERDEHDLFCRDTGKLGGIGVGADGIEAAAVVQVARHKLEEDHHREGERDGDADPETADGKQVEPREVDDPCRQRVDRHGPGTRVFDEDTAVDGEGAEGDDNRGHPAPRNDDPVDRPEEGAAADRQQNGGKRRHLVEAGKLRADKIGRAADDRAYRQVDIPGEHNKGLAGRDDGNDGDA